MLNDITGQLIFRDINVEAKPPKGMKFMLVMGVVAVNEKLSPVEDNHVVTIAGDSDEDECVWFDMSGSKRVPSKFDAWEANDIFREFPWKVARKNVELESSRSYDFHVKANRALKIISGTEVAKSAEIASLLKDLTAYKATLEDVDIMVTLLETILKILQSK